jgi:hypothetical protein
MVSVSLLLFSCNSKKEINDITARLDEFLTGQAKYFHFNGNVLVTEKGEIIFQKSFGLSYKTGCLLLGNIQA